MIGKISVITDRDILARAVANLPTETASRIAKVAFESERDVKESMKTSPSAAGDPPGVDTGALRASIRAEEVNPYLWRVFTGVDYDVYLEYGTSRMAARPYMGPMSVRSQKRLSEAFNGFPL